ncbi:MAG: dTDP-4-dehydrorhamnose reductase [Bacteroidaceae bacterium]|nr:dTDP-4-dehydrorhamnose reductase [Bacteroidaceae bacterium]
MNILVTGANGQLGSELRLLAPEHPAHTFHFTDVEELDITDAEAVRQFVKDNAIEALINCAAFTAVDKAESQPDLCRRLNAEAPRLLAGAMQAVGGYMIHVSTDYVFDGTAHTPYSEEAPTCPASVYGHTKLAGEQAVVQACPASVIVRTAWLYSPFGNNFVKTMLRLGHERADLGVIADQIGTPTYAADLAAALLTIVEKGPVAGIYHFTDEGACSWYDFTCEIHRQAGITSCHVRPLHTEEYPTPAARPHYSVLDKTKIKQTYGISIPWWPESLSKCIKRLGEI